MPGPSALAITEFHCMLYLTSVNIVKFAVTALR